ncbi:MAG: DUF6504 family protein [Firmicutes bacterium]|nr:DUF6504 family protein [Bacillota bacterium]
MARVRPLAARTGPAARRVAQPAGPGLWGVGRDYYRLLLEDGRLVDIYYDRRPRGSKKGQWVLFREIGTLET